MQRKPFFTEATTENLKLRLALSGTSGSGKSFSSLSIASHLGENPRIAFLDSENSSGRRYARYFKFYHHDLKNHHPSAYIEGIEAAEAEGFDVIIIDSLSHAWLAELDLVGGVFSNWNKVRPIERKLVQAILSCNCHVIVTMRSKTEWGKEEYVKDGKTKIQPVKIGTETIQAKGIEYEFDLAGYLDSEHILTIEKTRFPVFDNQTFLRPGKKFAEIILDELLSHQEGDVSKYGEEQVIITPTENIAQFPTNGNGKKSTKSSIDRDKYIALTTEELKRLCWTNEQGKDFLIKNYKQRSRQTLSDQDLLDFYNRLKSIPTPAVEKISDKSKAYYQNVISTLEMKSAILDEALAKFPEKEMSKDDLKKLLDMIILVYANDVVYMDDDEILKIFHEKCAGDYSINSIKRWSDYLNTIDLEEEVDPEYETVKEDEYKIEQSSPFDNPEFLYEVSAILNYDSDLLDDEIEKYERLDHNDIEAIAYMMAEEFATEECDLSMDRVKESWVKRVVGKGYTIESIGAWKEFILEADQIESEKKETATV